MTAPPRLVTRTHRIAMAVLLFIVALGLAVVWLGSAWLVFKLLGWL